ncbi:MAG: glycosyltransferase family 4 protein [Actinomycetota bacterium]
MSRVLLVGKGPPDRGGISAFLQTLLGSELTSKHDVRLLNLTRDEVPRAGRLTAANIRRTLADARNLRRAAKGADIVHIHTALVPAVTLVRAGLLCAAARAGGAKVLVHVHSGLVELWITSVPRRRLARASLSGANHVVTMSNPTRKALAEAIGAGKTSVIDNGVDVERFHPGEAADRTPRILYAGLLTPRKGVVDLINASDELAGRGVAHELVIAGGTPDEGPQDERTVREAAPVSAQLLGALPYEEMPQLYRGSDVFCLPSWFEAMPLSILEAMASGLPVVATDVGDVRRIVEHGVTGSVVPPKRPDLLAEALAELLTDASKRRAMGDAGRKLVEDRFATRHMIGGIDALYGQLLP